MAEKGWAHAAKSGSFRAPAAEQEPRRRKTEILTPTGREAAAWSRLSCIRALKACGRVYQFWNRATGEMPDCGGGAVEKAPGRTHVSMALRRRL